MKSRVKFRILLGIGIIFMLGLFWSVPASADHVSTDPSTSQNTQSTSTSAAQTNNNSSQTSGNQSSTNPNTKSDSSNSDNSTTTSQADNMKGAPVTTTKAGNSDTTNSVTVPVVSNGQQASRQTPATQVSGNTNIPKNSKRITLTTPSRSMQIKPIHLNRAFIPSPTNTALFFSGEFAFLGWLPTFVIINTLI